MFCLAELICLQAEPPVPLPVPSRHACHPKLLHKGTLIAAAMPHAHVDLPTLRYVSARLAA